MAHIAPHGSRWRAFVVRQGVRKTRIFPTEDEAREWAEQLELAILSTAVVDDETYSYVVPAAPAVFERRLSAGTLGSAGISFVEFQLARFGCETTRTIADSSSGDLWAQTPQGRISIEVKTSYNGSRWFIRPDQTGGEFYVLVTIRSASCYILTQKQLTALLHTMKLVSKGVYSLAAGKIPKEYRANWKTLLSPAWLNELPKKAA